MNSSALILALATVFTAFSAQAQGPVRIACSNGLKMTVVDMEFSSKALPGQGLQAKIFAKDAGSGAPMHINRVVGEGNSCQANVTRIVCADGRNFNVVNFNFVSYNYGSQGLLSSIGARSPVTEEGASVSHVIGTSNVCRGIAE